MWALYYKYNSRESIGKGKSMSIKYRPRNKSEENDFGWKEFVKVEKDEQRAINQKIDKGIYNLTHQNKISTSLIIEPFVNL